MTPPKKCKVLANILYDLAIFDEKFGHSPYYSYSSIKKELFDFHIHPPKKKTKDSWNLF